MFELNMFSMIGGRIVGKESMIHTGFSFSFNSCLCIMETAQGRGVRLGEGRGWGGGGGGTVNGGMSSQHKECSKGGNINTNFRKILNLVYTRLISRKTKPNIYTYVTKPNTYTYVTKPNTYTYVTKTNT